MNKVHIDRAVRFCYYKTKREGAIRRNGCQAQLFVAEAVSLI